MDKKLGAYSLTGRLLSATRIKCCPPSSGEGSGERTPFPCDSQENKDRGQLIRRVFPSLLKNICRKEEATEKGFGATNRTQRQSAFRKCGRVRESSSNCPSSRQYNPKPVSTEASNSYVGLEDYQAKAIHQNQPLQHRSEIQQSAIQLCESDLKREEQ